MSTDWLYSFDHVSMLMLALGPKYCSAQAQPLTWLLTWLLTLRTRLEGRFSHHMKHFCHSSAFLLHDNSMQAPLKPQPSFQLCKVANRKACESNDYVNL